MTPDVAALLVLTSLVLLVAPKRWAPFALFAGACYMTRGQAINLGPLHFYVARCPDGDRVGTGLPAT